MATHSSVLAWRILGTGEPDGLPSMGSQSQTRLKQLSSSRGQLVGCLCVDAELSPGRWDPVARSVAEMGSTLALSPPPTHPQHTPSDTVLVHQQWCWSQWCRFCCVLWKAVKTEFPKLSIPLFFVCCVWSHRQMNSTENSDGRTLVSIMHDLKDLIT